MTAVPWLIAALWAFVLLVGGVVYHQTVPALIAAVGLLACLCMAAQGWWAAYQAYEPEGRHRGGVR